jgi:hypothetical protein
MTSSSIFTASIDNEDYLDINNVIDIKAPLYPTTNILVASSFFLLPSYQAVMSGSTIATAKLDRENLAEGAATSYGDFMLIKDKIRSNYYSFMEK